MQYKLHIIARSNSDNPTLGVTIPKEIAQFFSGTYFHIELARLNGSYGFMCISGAVQKPTEKEIENYKFEDCRIV